MSSRHLLLLLCMLVVCGSLSGWLMVRYCRNDSPRFRLLSQDDPLVIEAKHLDFGDVWVRDRFRHVVPVRNDSVQDVRVLDVVSSCSCVEVSPRQFAIAPGQTIDVAFVLNLQVGELREVQLPRRDFSTRFRIVVDGKHAAHVVRRLSGTVMSPYAIETCKHDWGSVMEDVAVTPLTVRLSCYSPAKELLTDFDSNVVACHVERLSSTDYNLTIRPLAATSLGLHEFRIDLKVVDANEETARGPSFFGSFEAVSHVFVSPSFVNFGVTRVGQTRERTLVIDSLLGKPFDVTGIIRGSSDAISAECSDECRPSTSAEVRFRLIARSVGSNVCNAHISILDQSGKEISLPIEIVYWGEK